MHNIRGRLVVAFVTLCTSLVIVPATGAVHADHVTGTGINCWGAISGEADGIHMNETAVFIVKCTAADPMPTWLAQTLSAGCAGSEIFRMDMRWVRASAVGNNLGNYDWCPPADGGISATFVPLGIGVSHGDLTHTGGTITGNDPSYPANTFAVTNTFTYCPASNCGGPAASPYVTPEWVQFSADDGSATVGAGQSGSADRWWTPGLANEPCGADADCQTFFDGWAHPFVGGEEWPPEYVPVCESITDDWDTYDGEAQSLALDLGEVETVTLTKPVDSEPWSEIDIDWSWLWWPVDDPDEAGTWAAYELAGFRTTDTAAMRYVQGDLVELSATIATLTIRAHRDGVRLDWANLRCRHGGVESYLHRNDESAASSSVTPVRRACFFLKVRFGLSATLEDPTPRVRYEFSDDMAPSGGVLGLRYYRFGFQGAASAVPSDWFTDTGGATTADFPFDEDGVYLAEYDFTGTSAEQAQSHGPVDCKDAHGILRFEPPDPGAGGDRSGGVSDDGEAIPPAGPSSGPDDGVGDGGDTGTGTGVPTGGGGGIPTDGVGPSCFDAAGWSLINPVSWVTGGIKVGGCYLGELLIPDPDVIEAEYDALKLALSDHAPFSWFYAGLSMVTAFADSLPGAVAAHAGDCYTYAPAGSGGSEFASVPALEVCPATSMAGSGWDVFRPWAGRFVWVTWAIGCMMAAGRLWGMGGTESWYLANEYNPGGV